MCSELRAIEGPKGVHNSVALSDETYNSATGPRMRLTIQSPTQAPTRFLLVGGLFIAALLLSLTIFAALRHLEDQNALTAFHDVAHGRFDAVEVNIRLTLDNINALGAFFDSSNLVERR